jgi:REP element-mobilizing transposase RayT
LAIGGTADHIHLLIQIPATVYVAKVVGEVKGSSSHLINSRFPEEGLFKWQGAYGAFSVSRSMVPKVKEYIEKQKRHHAENTLSSEFEPPMDEDE